MSVNDGVNCGDLAGLAGDPIGSRECFVEGVFLNGITSADGAALA